MFCCVRAYAADALSLYARTQRLTENTPYKGLWLVVKTTTNQPVVVNAGKRHLPVSAQIPKMGIRVRWPLSDRLSACYHFGNRQNQWVKMTH